MALTKTSVGLGNTLAVKHGAQSPRIVAARTEAIVEAWTTGEDALPFTTAADRAAVYAAASAYARLQELNEYLEGNDPNGRLRGSLDSRGRPRGAMRLYFTAYREVMAGLRQLGATPAGRADLATGVAALHSVSRAEAAQERLRKRVSADQAGDQ